MDDLAERDVEQLSSELAWIRRLAYAIVKDADVADDISQEAWLAARRSAPGDRPLRPWLARVIRNLVKMQSRSDVRREHREAAVADDARAPAADELVDRVAMQRALADAVLALSEPYRSTVLLHYFEGLSSAEIARRLQIPDGTVRRRLKFALDELRAHFERRDRRGLYALDRKSVV
jgi:RNA polymerase sigma-70 factor (ECF subfamily)